jgi:hypothetical protein
MLKFQKVLPVKFICGFIYSSEDNYRISLKRLCAKYGPLDFESPKISFDFTEYYAKEMGQGLTRVFISFKRLRDPGDFIEIKRFCVALENKLAKNSKRSVNVDPGYLNEAKLVLTTTKDFYHRIYLGKGVFAEVTMAYSAKEKTFTDFPTTFPDYRTKGYKDILIHIRDLYRAQIKSIV